MEHPLNKKVGFKSTNDESTIIIIIIIINYAALKVHGRVEDNLYFFLIFV